MYNFTLPLRAYPAILDWQTDDDKSSRQNSLPARYCARCHLGSLKLLFFFRLGLWLVFEKPFPLTISGFGEISRWNDTLDGNRSHPWGIALFLQWRPIGSPPGRGDRTGRDGEITGTIGRADVKERNFISARRYLRWKLTLIGPCLKEAIKRKELT